jgi:pyrophosphatase PpaX
MLEGVQGAGLRTAIVTSKNRYGTERGLRVTGLEAFVDAIVPSDEVVHPKPHPEPVERALASLGISAERAVFVGDSLHDLECGRAARVQTAAALWGPFSRQDLERGRPDHWLETPGALTALALEGDAPSGEA